MASFFLRNTFYCLLLSFCSFCLFSCTSIDVFEKNNVFSQQQWTAKDTVKGTFTISDTNSFYNLYLVLRHTDKYQYNNIWINMGLKAQGDTMHYQKISFTLGSDATGWYGTGMSDIWEVRNSINQQPRRFKKIGTYEYHLINCMRDDPLKYMMSTGLRVEKKQ